MISSKGKNLIFLISQPRAGSTLLQLILSGHPDIATTSEPWVALHPVFAIKESGICAIYNSNFSRNAVSDFLKQIGEDEKFYKQQIGNFLLSFYNQALLHQGKKIFLDKTPRYYHIIDELAEIFSEAKFILLYRNPLAVLNSILKTWCHNNLSNLIEYKDDLLLAPCKMLEFEKKIKNKTYRVNYEAFVYNPEGVLKSICDFIGIIFHESMLDYSRAGNKEWKFGDQIGVYKSTRPTANAVDNWKKGLTDPQKKILAKSYIKKLGSEVIQEMGYDYYEIESCLGNIEKRDSEKLKTWLEIFNRDKEFLEIRLLREIELLKAQHNALLNSMSWKITAPARLLYDKLFRKK